MDNYLIFAWVSKRHDKHKASDQQTGPVQE